MEYISLNLRLEFREFCVGLVIRQIDDIFQMAGIELGQAERDFSGARRSRIEDYYASIDWNDLADVQKFLKVIELVLSQSYTSDIQREFLRGLCTQSGLIIEGHQITLQMTSHGQSSDLFANQFPGGLPFGREKPDFSVTASKGVQSLKFELKSGIGILWKDVYPDFDFPTFQAACGIDSATNLALKIALFNMNQTPCEKSFFKTYARHFKMADNHVPMLVPQAWVQWHSLSKKVLRAAKRPIANELYRIDFAMFWENRRYAILIDDISHYAIQRGSQWIADEESYAKRIEEDRKLQAEGWKIFRVSNWEIKQKKADEIIIDLQNFVGFEV